jgi:hypothetical protein
MDRVGIEIDTNPAPEINRSSRKRALDAHDASDLIRCDPLE